MPRLAAVLLCALAALAVQATPVPPPKPWVTGWDQPVDPDGDCRFERKGDKVTINCDTPWVCHRIRILRRPGGRVPAPPVTAGLGRDWHNYANAWQDWEE